MSRRTPWRSERSSGLLDDALDLELGFGGAGEGRSQMEQGNLVRLAPLERRLDQREGRTSQHAVDQKEVAETVGVKSLNSPSLHDWHSSLLPALGAIFAREILEHNTGWLSSYKRAALCFYGLTLFHSWNFATGGRAA